MVSIITPSHNSSRFIVQTIISVFNQTYNDWELIIVDDCSTDNSLDVIYETAGNNPKVKITALKANVGAAEARNVGLRQALGRYIAFLDSDDVWCPNKLEHQLAFMSSNNYSFSFTAYDLMNEDGKLLNKTIDAPRMIGYNRYLRNTIIGCLTVVIDKEAVGYFEMPDIRSSHDMALWLQILKRGFNAYGLNEVQAIYRIVNSSNTANKKKAALDVWRVYRETEKLSLFYSSVCFLGYAINAIKKRVL
jgi:teichuronic acid biosynthesis glycosyltransferase TuaG